MEELGAGALSCGNFSGEEIAFLGSSQRYMSDPRLALAYRHCFGVDPAGFVFGDEQLHGGKRDVTRERLMNIFDDYPKPNDLTACQNLADPTKSPFSAASGHDYGRVGELQELTQIVLDYIAPIQIDDSGQRRRQLMDLENAIDDSVHVTDSGMLTQCAT
ncbi:hypothetical protein PInf_023451 [Phytophthora infestans]|nr:hypothetical protein PInf_023451 [Phytophthora infestans]